MNTNNLNIPLVNFQLYLFYLFSAWEIVLEQDQKGKEAIYMAKEISGKPTMIMISMHRILLRTEEPLKGMFIEAVFLKFNPDIRASNSRIRSGIVHTNNKPEAKLIYGAEDMNGKATDTTNFKPAKDFEMPDNQLQNRNEDYNREANNAREPQLKDRKEQMTYDLDSIDGVSQTPLVNTFHYNKSLFHHSHSKKFGTIIIHH